MTQSVTTQSLSTGGARQRLPFSVRVADVLTVLLCAAAVSVVLFGGFRFRVAAVILTVHSAFRLLLLAALLSAIRHYFRRTPSLLSRVSDGLRRFWRSESFRAISPSFAWSRAAVFMVAYLSVITIGYPTKILFRVSNNEMVNLPARWDAGWYLGIAREGYRYDPLSKHQQNVAFFPMYPMTTSVLGIFLGGHVDEGEARFSSPARMVWAGVLLNLAALAAALGYCTEWYVDSRTVRRHCRQCSSPSPTHWRSFSTEPTRKGCSYSRRSQPFTTSDGDSSRRRLDGARSPA